MREKFIIMYTPEHGTSTFDRYSIENCLATRYARFFPFFPLLLFKFCVTKVNFNHYPYFIMSISHNVPFCKVARFGR